MSKYASLWKYVSEYGQNSFKLTYNMASENQREKMIKQTIITFVLHKLGFKDEREISYVCSGGDIVTEGIICRYGQKSNY